MTTTHDDRELAARIRAALPPDEPGDWNDVLDRARPPRRRRRRRAALVLAFAALLAALSALLPDRLDGDDRIVERALAAIGAGPVLHVVLDRELSSVTTGPRPEPVRFWRVELESGASQPVQTTNELWWDSGRGLLRSRFEIGGVVHFDGVQRRRADEPFGVDPALAAFVTGYRAALENGDASVAREGVLGDRDVVWLRFPGLAAGGAPGEVAVDGETYRPVAVAYDSTVYRVAEIESRGRATADFEAQPASTAPPFQAVSSTREPVQTSALGPPWPEEEPVAVTRVVATGHSAYPPTAGNVVERTAALVARYRDGSTVAQAREAAVPFEGLAFRAEDGRILARSGAAVPPEGGAELAQVGARWFAQLRRDGVYVEVSGPSRARVLELARAAGG